MQKSKRILAIILILCLICPSSLFPTVFAAGNEDIGSENALDALGIDTSLLPEGYDSNTLDNPYGRDTVTVNPVYELFVANSFGRREADYSQEPIHDGEGNVVGTIHTNITQTYRHNILHGHNHPLGKAMQDFYGSQAANNGEQLWQEAIDSTIYDNFGILLNEEHSETNYGDAVAATSAGGNFIGGKSAGKTSQTVTVSAGSLLATGGLFLSFTDPVTGVQSEKRTLLACGKTIGNIGEKMDEDFTESPHLLQNFLKIAAGDFDNDGIDEVAVYVPEQGKSRVEVYKLHRTTGADDDFYLGVGNWKKEWTYYFNEAPFVSNMVSLTAGDFDQDGTDDLALTWGYYYGPGQNNGCQGIVLCGSNTNMLQKKKTIDLTFEGAGIVRAAFAYGDIDGDNVKDLVLGGQLASDIAGGNYNTRFIGVYSYDGFSDSFLLTTAKNFDLFAQEEGSYVHAPMAGRNDRYFSSPACAANIAVVALKGMGHDTYIYLDSILYSYGDEGLVVDTPLDQSAGFNKNPQNPYYAEFGAIAADFTGDSKETVTIMQYYFPYFEITPLWYWWFFPDMEETFIPGDLDMLSVFWDTNLTFHRNDDLDFLTCFCKLNTDNDTSLLSYTGKHYVTYSDPAVLAVLASPPYFADLARDDLSGSYMSSETSYTASSGSGSGSTHSHTLSLGLYVSFQHDFLVPVTGTKVGGMEAEASYTTNLTWEKTHTSTLEQSISYATSAGEDAVAFYSIPVETYVYTSLVPILDTTGNVVGYDEQHMSVNIPHTAAVKVLPLETYERIAADYPELPQIAGDVLRHTVGDPSTYPNSPGGFKEAKVFQGDWSGVNYGAGSISQELTMTEETESSFTHAHNIEAKIGAGPGDFIFGRTFGYEYGSGTAQVTTNGSSFASTMYNMPLEAEPYHYYCAWKLFCYEYSKGSSSFPVVSYLVTDVTAPPKLPQDFQQDVAGTTADQISMEWSYTGAVAGFQLYRYYEFPDGGGSYELAFVPASAAVGADPGSGTRYYKYVDYGLDDYAQYNYQIQVVGATVPSHSIISPINTFRTKTAYGHPEVRLEGVTDGRLLVYPDTNSTVRTIVENREDYTQNPRYQWQKFEGDGWNNIPGAIGESYTFKTAGLGDEGRYRCRVNVIFQDYYISDYSDEFTLLYSKRTPKVVENSFKVTEVINDSGELVSSFEIALMSAHPNHYYLPSGNVLFEISGADYNRSFAVTLDTSGQTGIALANLVLDHPLPEGAYEISALYTGSRVYKSLAVTAIPYLSGNESGYILTLDSSHTYGEDILPTLKRLAKDDNGETEIVPVTENIVYKVCKYEWVIVLKFGFLPWLARVAVPIEEFTFQGGVTAARTGAFTLIAFINNQEVAKKEFTVTKRPLTLGIHDQSAVAGESGLEHPNSSILFVAEGELVYADNISALGLAVQATDTAGRVVQIDESTDPGAYTIIGIPRENVGPKYENYSIKYLPGTYTLTGPKYSIRGISQPLNGKTVGTVELITPEGNDNTSWTTKHPGGTNLVFMAQPYAGYSVKSWTIVKDTGEVIATEGSNIVLNHQMLAENIEVLVEFQVAQHTLMCKAGNHLAGTVECTSDPAFANGGIARNGAQFTFKATPAAGYHFVEWQLTEVGKSPSNPEETPDDDGSCSCTITMGKGNTMLYAIFARDNYKLTLMGDLHASYWQDTDNNTETPDELIVVESGAYIEGDKEVVVSAKPGFSVQADAVWLQNGLPVTAGVSADNQRYTFTILADTVVAAESDLNHYDVSLEITGPGSDSNQVTVTVNGVPIGLDELDGLAGGSTLAFTPLESYGYVFNYWLVNGKSIAERVFHVPALCEGLVIKAVFKNNTAYSISVDHNSRGTLSYSLNEGESVQIAAGDAIPVFKGDTVVLTAHPETSFMVEHWVIDGALLQSYAKVQTFEDIGADIAVTVFFGAQSYSTVTYSAGAGGAIVSATSDGIEFESGNNSIGNGSTLVFVAKPESGKMVAGWEVDGVKIENDFGKDFVDTVFTIPVLSGNTDVLVLFTDQRTHSVLFETENCSISAEYQPEYPTGVRAGAAAVFTVTPDPAFDLETVEISGALVSDFDALVKNEDGSWICTLYDVQCDSTIRAIAVDPKPRLDSELLEYLTGHYPGFIDLVHDSGNLDQGQVSELNTVDCNGGHLVIGLHWGGSAFKLSLYSPDGNLYSEVSAATSPVALVAPFAEPGTWTYTVTALAVPCPNYPYAVIAGEVEAVLQGPNRYQTAVKISRSGWADGSNVVLLARGDGFPDGLSGVPLAYKLGAPILLSNSKTLNEDTREEILRLGAEKVIILGGSGAISEEIEAELVDIVETVTRLGGNNRYDTSALIALELAQDEKLKGAFIVTGEAFPDALTAGSYAAIQGLPVLLTKSKDMPQVIRQTLAALEVEQTVVVGGYGAVSEAVFATLPAPVRVSGNNRYETALALAEMFLPDDIQQVYIATGLDFPDALAGGALAARGNSGVLLLPGKTGQLPLCLEEYLGTGEINSVVIFGGPGVVCEAVKDSLRAILK